MTTKIKGSIRVTMRLRVNSIDSSKWSDVCPSISGKAPVDSPTRIIASAMSGTQRVSAKASDTGRPSSTS